MKHKNSSKKEKTLYGSYMSYMVRKTLYSVSFWLICLISFSLSLCIFVLKKTNKTNEMQHYFLFF